MFSKHVRSEETLRSNGSRTSDKSLSGKEKRLVIKRMLLLKGVSNVAITKAAGCHRNLVASVKKEEEWLAELREQGIAPEMIGWTKTRGAVHALSDSCVLNHVEALFRRFPRKGGLPLLRKFRKQGFKESLRTVTRWRKELGFRGHRVRPETPLTEWHHVARLNYANKFLGFDFGKVCWTDESYFTLGEDKRVVWCKLGGATPCANGSELASRSYGLGGGQSRGLGRVL